MSALAGLKQPSPNGVIRAVLSGSMELEENAVYQSFVSYGAEKPFWVMVAQASGYQPGDTPDLQALATHIMLTATTRTLRPELLAGLDRFISVPHQTWCYDFVTDWLHSPSAFTLVLGLYTALPVIWNMNITSAGVLLNVKSAIC
jgi:hypothetical protein